MNDLNILVGSHSYIVKVTKPHIVKILEQHSIRYRVYQPRLNKRTPPKYKSFSARTECGNEFRFHINTLRDLKKLIKKHGLSYMVSRLPKNKVVNIDIVFKKGWKPRDNQQYFIDYLNKEDNINAKLIELTMGGGKSYISTRSIQLSNNRTVFIVLARYIKKWVIDLNKMLMVKPNTIRTIQGTDQLKTLLFDAEEDCIDNDIIIISNRTYLNYIKEYELTNGILDEDIWPCSPTSFFNYIGAGTLYVDEAHQDFCGVFKTILYSNVDLFVGLTATLVARSPELNKIYNTMFPKYNRIYKGDVVKYTDLYAVRYELKRGLNIRYSPRGMNSYSHVEYEKSIMRNSRMLKEYLEMILHYFNAGYMEHRTTGDRSLIFCSTVDLCEIVKSYIKRKHKYLNVGTYVAKDDIEELTNNDVIVSTVLSSGTAVDIPELITVIQTISINSMTSNLQSFGRLRNIKEKQMRYYYIYTSDIPKQLIYHTNKISLYRDLSKEIYLKKYNKILG